LSAAHAARLPPGRPPSSDGKIDGIYLHVSDLRRLPFEEYVQISTLGASKTIEEIFDP
jgi:hypothetical protein